MIIRRILLAGIVMQCLWLVAGCCYDVTEVFFQWTGMRIENLDNSGPCDRRHRDLWIILTHILADEQYA
jgi:hypothetical protein